MARYACAAPFCAAGAGVAGCDVAGCGGADAGPSIGSPCVPAQEMAPTFAAFSENEVNVNVLSLGADAPVCLVYHFRGRVSCPYGQDMTGHGPSGASACVTTDGGTPVTAAVPAQCTDRRARDTVTYTCRCQNTAGRTDDGASYCVCPSGTTCTQAVSNNNPSDPLTGAYCIKDVAKYDRASACSASCDPVSQPCP